MSEILQLSFISSKSRHLSALCVSEIMLGSLANNCDREGAKSHRGGTLIHTGSFKVRSGLLHNQLRPSDESTEHMQGPCILIVLTKLIINDDIDHVNRKNGQQSVSLDQMFNNSNLYISNKIIYGFYFSIWSFDSHRLTSTAHCLYGNHKGKPSIYLGRLNITIALQLLALKVL